MGASEHHSPATRKMARYWEGFVSYALGAREPASTIFHSGKNLTYVILPVPKGRRSFTLRSCMKFPGFLLLLAGWVIDVAAVMLVIPPNARVIFVLAGVGVEFIGLALVIRSNPLAKREEN